MFQSIQRGMTQLGVITAHPLAFILVFAYGVGWFLFDRENFDWHAVATLSIWFMTLVIQRAEHRDTQAIQAKLDELIRAQVHARNEMTRIDEQEPEAIERHRAEAHIKD
jgi:low affinity Fe/Cu permease